MKLYFARHGESEANLLREISNRGSQHGLTERGRAQAAALAERLCGVGFARIYTSPLLRAVQTALIIGQALGVPVETSAALREYDCGILEGKSDEASWRIHSQTRASWLREKAWDTRIEGGESFLDIQARFVPWIESLAQAYGRTESNLLLVGHGGTYQCMLPLLLSNVGFEQIERLPFPNTALVIAELRADGWYCLEWEGK